MGILAFSAPNALAADDTKGSTESGGDQVAQPEAMLEHPLPSKAERERQRMDRLAASIDDGSAYQISNTAKVVWLKAADQEFLSIHTPASLPKTEGTLLLLHAEGEHPLWLGALSNIQQYFPEKGWATLAIALPDQDEIEPPAPPTAEEIAKHTTTKSKDDNVASEKTNASGDPVAGKNESKEIFDDAKNEISDGSFTPTDDKQAKEKAESSQVENQTQDRIIAAVKYLQENGGDSIVLVGQGLGGFRASHYLQESGSTIIKGMILIDALNQSISIDKKLTDSFSNPDFPLLDLISEQSTSAIKTAKIRRNEAKRQGMKKFQQRRITSSDNDTLLKVTYGFLKTNCQ